MVATYLSTYLVRWLTLCILLGMTIRKNYPSGLKRWNGNFLTMPKNISSRKFVDHHHFQLHNQFGEFFGGFAHLTKS